MATAMALTVQSSAFSNFSSMRHNLMGSPTLSGKRLLPRIKIVAEAESDQKKKGEDESFSPFKFVTDNPSSRNAIQMPLNPVEDGNVGQMIYKIENKGKDYGSYIKVGGFKWFVRETGSSETKLGTIVFIHGAPTQSFSYRVVMAQMADAGYHCYAPDWLGFGFSQKPQPGFDFAYTEEAFHEEFEKLLIELGIDTPFIMVTQGFLMGSYGLTWALKNPSKIEKVAILNGPLTPSAPVPGLFKKLQFPLLGEFTCQNAIMAERFIEGGSPYVLKNEKADVYRLPYLSSMGPGFGGMWHRPKGETEYHQEKGMWSDRVWIGEVVRTDSSPRWPSNPYHFNLSIKEILMSQRNKIYMGTSKSNHCLPKGNP